MFGKVRFIILFFFSLCFSKVELFAQALNFNVSPLSNKYGYKSSEIPNKLVAEESHSGISGITYQWEKSEEPLTGFTNISGATFEFLDFSQPINKTTFYQRKTIYKGLSYYSNLIRYELVANNWEDKSYKKEVVLLVPGISSIEGLSNTASSNKSISSVYFDGLGREVQTIVNESATPVSGNTWGDIVSFKKYDTYGMQTKSELPYVSLHNLGGFKEGVETSQRIYYHNKFNDAKPYEESEYFNDPFGEMKTVKGVGELLNSTDGYRTNLTLNTLNDHIPFYEPGTREFTAEYFYTPNKLIKKIETDIYGKKTVYFTNLQGQLVLKKVQIDDNPLDDITGWACNLYLYDLYGNLIHEITPEGVKLIYEESWDFNTGNGIDALNNYAFSYDYDAKNRLISKKNPGGEWQHFIYDKRDRLVATQDGNQAIKSIKEWTVHLYDEFDRNVVDFIYKSNQSRQQLQTFFDGADETMYSVHGTYPYLNPFLDADYNNENYFYTLKVYYYDDYSSSNVLNFDATLASSFSAVTNALTIGKTNRTFGMSTGTYTRVLQSNTFLKATTYYDEDGNVIQALEENILGGIDISTMQYHWNGALLAKNEKHGAPNKPFDNYRIHTTYSFDKLWRPKDVFKKFGTNPVRKINTYEYNDIGQLKKKTLSPDYADHYSGIGIAGGGLESQDFSYNIQGMLVGVNKDYALKTGSYNKWQHFFGYFLGYDKTEAVFTGMRLNGQMKGQVWNTMGDDEQRKFEYTYDNAGRLLNAGFTQKIGSNWSNSFLDYSTGGYTGKVEYDLNGNLKSMSQKGFIYGQTSSVVIDDLRYTYANNGLSNKLLKVTDQTAIGTTLNGTNSDFKDGSNTDDDYVYDANGNLIVDLNKGVRRTPLGNPGVGIVYNYLDKPEKIYLNNGINSITYTYDADGRKLKWSRENKIFLSTYTKEVYYVGNYIYESNTENALGAVLKFINTDEGQLRIITPIDENNGYDGHVLEGNISTPGGTHGVFDFFLSDYRSDTRMILTEEIQHTMATASMETAGGRNTVEERIFGTAGAANEVLTTRIANVSGIGWTSNSSGFVSRLNSSKPVGPNQLLKVMGGDLVSAYTKYYYENAVVNTGTTSTIINAVLGTFAGTLASSAATGTVMKSNAVTVANNLNSGIFGTQWSDLGNTSSTKPKAYLNIMFFDERMQYIEESSTSVRVTTSGNGAPDLALMNIKAPKNGYCMVFVSNESNEYVYFDDMMVYHDRGRILEENHYYAFGLKIASLSSRSIGAPQNAYGYQGEFNEFDDDLSWNDFALRSYDPQIGRFLQNDPYEQFSSGYVGMGNDPTNMIDEDGGWSRGLTGMAIGAVAGFSAPYIYEAITGEQVKNKGALGFVGAFIGAGVGFGIGESTLSTGKRFLNETKAFYSALFGVTPNTQIGGATSSILCPKPGAGGLSNVAYVPDLWSWMGNINLSLNIPPIFKWVDVGAFYSVYDVVNLTGQYMINRVTDRNLRVFDSRGNFVNVQGESSMVILPPKLKEGRNKIDWRVGSSGGVSAVDDKQPRGYVQGFAYMLSDEYFDNRVRIRLIPGAIDGQVYTANNIRFLSTNRTVSPTFSGTVTRYQKNVRQRLKIFNKITKIQRVKKII